MSKIEYQTMFIGLYQYFVIEKSRDDLTLKFLNALILFNRGLEQKNSRDTSLALLLYLTAAESLLTENKNEKSLRLSAILSRLVKINNVSIYEMSTLIKQLYQQRNNFVHAGERVNFSYEDKSLEILQIAVAKLILMFLDIDNILDNQSTKSRVNLWNEYVDNVFNSIIFGDKSS